LLRAVLAHRQYDQDDRPEDEAWQRPALVAGQEALRRLATAEEI
jgi:hypothetical protein